MSAFQSIKTRELRYLEQIQHENLLLYLCVLFVIIHTGDFNVLDSDVQLANGRPTYSSDENVLNTSKKKSNGKSGGRKKTAKKEQTEVLKNPETTELPVVTYGWMNIADDHGKYAFLLRRLSSVEWSELRNIVSEYIRMNKTYAPTNDPNAREKVAKAEILDKMMKEYEFFLRNSSVVRKQEQLKPTLTAQKENPETTELPVVTYGWMNIADDHEKYAFLLRRLSSVEWSELRNIVSEYIRMNKTYAPTNDPNAREKVAKAEILDKMMREYEFFLRNSSVVPKQEQLKPKLTAEEEELRREYAIFLHQQQKLRKQEQLKSTSTAEEEELRRGHVDDRFYRGKLNAVMSLENRVAEATGRKSNALGRLFGNSRVIQKSKTSTEKRKEKVVRKTSNHGVIGGEQFIIL
uniref:Uncharacterized protein n=1 Tax=Trichobilharzia regenti TaxID=157069 RepID=A0AA85IYH5_TRIRE|nr:unnamed protein product [Trichobilharzia regenti]